MSAAIALQTAKPTRASTPRVHQTLVLATAVIATLAAVALAPTLVFIVAVVGLIGLGIFALGRAAAPLFEHIGEIAR